MVKETPALLDEVSLAEQSLWLADLEDWSQQAYYLAFPRQAQSSQDLSQAAPAPSLTFSSHVQESLGQNELDPIKSGSVFFPNLRLQGSLRVFCPWVMYLEHIQHANHDTSESKKPRPDVGDVAPLLWVLIPLVLGCLLVQ
jgi:hypothetical protein